MSRAQLTTLHVQSQKQQSRRRYVANGFAFVPKDRCRCPRFPHAAFGRAVEPGMVWVFTFVRRDCGDA